MRLIGNVSSQQHAERIHAFLITRDISTHCEKLERPEELEKPSPTGQHESGPHDELWEVWVRDEDALDKAKTLLEEFKSDPDHPQYREAVDLAQKIAKEKEKKLQQVKSNQIQLRDQRWNAPITQVAPFTVALVAISVVVGLFFTQLGENRDSSAFRALAFGSITNSQAEKIIATSQASDNPLSDFPVKTGTDDNRLRLASILNGEAWRLITPVFLHFDIFHLIFNMYWTVIFGKQIEARYGSVWLATLVVLTAIPSNTIQCLVPAALDGSPIFNFGNHWTIPTGGMSGVIYGLFGYVWMKMTFDPKSNLFLPLSTITLMVVWLFICMVPGFPINVANWAHGIGLAAGLAIGYFPKLLSDLGLRRVG